MSDLDITPNGSIIRERTSGLLHTFLCQDGRFFYYRERFGRKQMHKEHAWFASRFSVVQGEKDMKVSAKDRRPIEVERGQQERFTV